MPKSSLFLSAFSVVAALIAIAPAKAIYLISRSRTASGNRIVVQAFRGLAIICMLCAFVVMFWGW